jgi:hypothetical protein
LLEPDFDSVLELAAKNCKSCLNAVLSAAAILQQGTKDVHLQHKRVAGNAEYWKHSTRWWGEKRVVCFPLECMCVFSAQDQTLSHCTSARHTICSTEVEVVAGLEYKLRPHRVIHTALTADRYQKQIGKALQTQRP